jgi:hypothetical protein
MALSATYNSVTVSPLQSWSERVEAVFASTGKEVIGYRHTFALQGFFDNSGGNSAGKKTDVDTVVLKMRESGQDLTITQDAVDIRSFDAADCQGTGPWSTFEIPGTDEEMKIGFNVPFIMTVTGVTDPPTATSGVTADTYEDTYSYDKQTRRTFTRSGTLSTASGTSALAKFAGTDPTTSLATSSIGWELDRKESRTDDDDQNLSYSWVFVEAFEAIAVSAADVEYNISSSMAGGTESWNATGRLRYTIATDMQESDVATLLSNNSAWPSSGVTILQEDIDTDTRTNTLSFTVRGEKPYGAGGTLSYEESVETISVRNLRDFHALGGTGKDLRQELTRPDITIIQSGSWVKTGSYPVEPKVVTGVAADVVEKRFNKSHITRDIDGKKHAYGLSWTYVIRPLNTTAAGSFKPAVDPTTTTPLDGQGPSRQTGA